MIKFTLASLVLAFSFQALAFEDWETACMDSTEVKINELKTANVTLTFREQLQIYQTCVTENRPEDGQSYEERCGDRRGGAYDNCTN